MTRAKARMALLVAASLLAAGAAGPSRKERLAALPEEDRVWLTEYVAPIILPEEEKLFLELAEPHERERFKREFWQRRERDSQPPPLGPGYGARYAELRRLADEVYDGWREDAGRMVLRYGEPPDVHEVRCDNVFRGLEIWTYTNTSIRPGRAQFFFYRFQPLVPRKLWDVGVSNKDIFQPNSCKQTFESLGFDCPGRASLTDRCSRPCPEDCDIYELYMQIRERQHNAFGALEERTKLLAPPLLPLEGIDRIKDVSATAADPNAKPLTVTGPSATVSVPAAPARAVKKMSKKERLANLPDDEREWLTSFAAPIILKEEEDLFLELTEGYQWEVYKKEFWERRERDGLGPPFGPGFKTRYEELRPRLDSVYDGWRNDASQLVLHYGEPADIHHVEGCDQVFRDVEIWTYTNLGMARGNVHHLFYRPSPVAPRKLWRETRTPMEKQQGTDPYKLDEIFSPGSCRKSLESLVADCVPRLGDPCRGPVCFEACDVYRVYQEELSRQGSALGGVVERARLFKLPEISTEGLDQLRKRFVTAPDPNARPLHVEGPWRRPTPEPTPTPEPLHGLTADEMRERILQLPPKYRQWLELAAPLLTLDELSLFLQLSPSEKDKFIRAFWKRRS